VCRPSGRIVLLNHFDHPDGPRGGLDGFLGRLASRAGVDWHIDLLAFLNAAGLTPLSIERVNVPRISSVVVCHKPEQPATG
jgi:hypothetical protein